MSGHDPFAERNTPEAAIHEASVALDRARDIEAFIDEATQNQARTLSLCCERDSGLRVGLFWLDRRTHKKECDALLRLAKTLQAREVETCLRALNKAVAKTTAMIAAESKNPKP